MQYEGASLKVRCLGFVIHALDNVFLNYAFRLSSLEAPLGGSMTNDVENWYMYIVDVVHIDVESLDLFSVDVCNIISKIDTKS